MSVNFTQFQLSDLLYMILGSCELISFIFNHSICNFMNYIFSNAHIFTKFQLFFQYSVSL